MHLAALACAKVHKYTFGCSRHNPSQLGFCSRLHKSTAPFSWGSVHTYLCGLQLRRLKFQSLGLKIQCRRPKNQLRRLKPRFRPRGKRGNGLPLPTQAYNRRKPAEETAKKRVKCLERTEKPLYLCAKIE